MRESQLTIMDTTAGPGGRSRHAKRRRPKGRVLGRIGFRRRTGRSECRHIDTRISDPRDVQRDAEATIRAVLHNSEDRDRAVHDLAHGPGSGEASRWVLCNAIQDHALGQDHRLAMADEYLRCLPEEASEALLRFALDVANDPFSRLAAARRIPAETQRRIAVVILAAAADLDVECRLKAAVALVPLALRDAEQALRGLATDVELGFEARLEAARHWAAVNKMAAIEVLWEIVSATDAPWLWRITAAAELVLLRVRAAKGLLLEWMENRELPEEARTQLIATLRKLDLQRAA